MFQSIKYRMHIRTNGDVAERKSVRLRFEWERDVAQR